ncbi:hypothetical protein TIFTF001_000029 [Ficus carica]|uniref:Glutamyl/glutaminyl-tRNA synthetase class Ib anti-codon binding domain-containing protein n=1 Tax=Ficus carica TaxID=3494 RepID=A0AA87YUC8_FICCA|nr:hypothetical protein TIFTF001_000029 [Ficus carica]
MLYDPVSTTIAMHSTIEFNRIWVDGWDDPRLPTVQGIVQRGLKIEALIKFILEQGASKNLNLMEWDKLWTINKKIIDPVCPRHTAIIEQRRALMTLTNGPRKPFVRIVPRHKKYECAGEKATTFTNKIWLDQGHVDEKDAEVLTVDEVMLMDWGNVIIKGIEKDQEGKVTQLTGVLHLEGSLEEGEDFLDVLNPCTKKETAAIADANMRNLKHREVLQLERKGYFRCDVPYLRPSKPIVLCAIPDGRQQTCLK